MELCCQLLLYFDKRRVLVDMKRDCESFLDDLTEKNINKFPPFRFLLEIDVIDLVDFCPKIGELLISEPLKWQGICTKILIATMESVNYLRKKIEPAQITVTIRLKSLPYILVRPKHNRYKPLVSFNGTLLAISKPTSYVHQSIWCCPEDCEGSEVLLHHIPKVSPKCNVCRSVQFENSGLRRCGEQVTAIFKLNNEIFPKVFNIKDDLILKLEIGLRYYVTVVVSKKVESVWSLEVNVPLSAPISSSVPSDEKELFRLCSEIPWKFVYCLASSIGVNVCPLHYFMHLKISLLLSLASIKANEVSNSKVIHVLAAGYDTSFVGQIMEASSQLATRSVFLGTTNTKASTALIASSGGVCLMQLPLHIYNQKTVNQILSAIESGEVNTDTERAKLRCPVWAHGMDFKKLVLSNIASVFGYICRGDLGEMGDELVDFHLQRAVEPAETDEEELRALRDLRVYLDYVAGLEVSLNGVTEKILTRYFLAARKERPRGFIARNMDSLVAICLTSARLCRRNVTNVDDAVFAIWLHVSGSPDPRFAPDEYLQTPADIKKLHKMMDKFKDWLEQFTGTML